MAKALFDLTGKVTVVTGGNSGFGLAFARGIAGQGGDLAIWARNEEMNAAAKKELGAFGARVITHKVDVAVEEQIVAGFDAVMEAFGRVDCVIANAGLPQTRSMLELSNEAFREADVRLRPAAHRHDAQHQSAERRSRPPLPAALGSAEPGPSGEERGAVDRFALRHRAPEAAHGATVRAADRGGALRGSDSPSECQYAMQLSFCAHFHDYCERFAIPVKG